MVLAVRASIRRPAMMVDQADQAEDLVSVFPVSVFPAIARHRRPVVRVVLATGRLVVRIVDRVVLAVRA